MSIGRQVGGHLGSNWRATRGYLWASQGHGSPQCHIWGTSVATQGQLGGTSSHLRGTRGTLSVIQIWCASMCHSILLRKGKERVHLLSITCVEQCPLIKIKPVSMLPRYYIKKLFCEYGTNPNYVIIIVTSSAGSATLGDTSWARLTTELIKCLRIRCGGHRTFQFWTFGNIFKLGWGHRTKF